MKISTIGDEISGLVKSIMELEWIPNEIIEQIDTKSLESYCTPFLELKDYFKSLKVPTILITNMPVFPKIPFYTYHGSSCISLASKTDLTIGCIHILKLLLNKTWCCPDIHCVFNENMSKPMQLCIDCENKLEKVDKGKPTAARMIALTHLAKIGPLNNVSLNSYLHQNDLQSSNALINHHIISRKIDATFKGRILNDVINASREIYEEKKKIDGHYVNKIGSISGPEIIINRRWNSWTPGLPTLTDIKKQVSYKIGGGYFISDGETRIVIDPGYGYMQSLFLYHGITVADIDAVIVTHDHPDHNAELINLFGLRFKYRKKTKSKLKLYLNASSYYLYYPYISYHENIVDEESIKTPIFSGQNIIINSICIKTINMLHDEMHSKLDEYIKKRIGIQSNSLGLVVGLNIEDKIWKIGIPGDTSFPEDDETIAKWHAFYKDCDILSLHLGSIEEDWSKVKNKKPSSISYGENSHLGINGAIFFIGMVRPKLAVITEFGVELAPNEYRLVVVEMIKTVTDNVSEIIPSDVDLALKIKNGEIMCRCKCEKGYVPIAKIQSDVVDEMICYRYPAGCPTRLHHH